MSKPQYPTDLIIEALKKTRGKVYVAAAELSIAPSTIYRRAQTVKAVQQEIDTQRETMLDIAEVELFRLIQAGNLGAIIWYLKTIGRTRGYKERVQIDHRLSDNEQVIVELIKHMEAANQSPGEKFQALVNRYANAEASAD